MRVAATSSATTAILPFAPGDYVVIPRGTMWRIDCAAPIDDAADRGDERLVQLPERGIVGAHAIFDPAMLDVPAIEADSLRSRSRRGDWRVA